MPTAVKALALVLIGLVVAAGVGFWSFTHDSRTVVIGAHTTTVAPTFDHHATFDFGPLIPKARIDMKGPLDLGVKIDVGATNAAGLNQLIAQDAVIASQPEGEVDKIRATVRSMALSAIAHGVGFGILVALATVGFWRGLGTRRRAQLRQALHRWPHPTRRTAYTTAAFGLVLVLGVVLAFWPQRHSAESVSDETSWEPLRTSFPELASDPVLDRIEVSADGTAATSKAIVDSAIQTYRTSVRFYGDLRDAVTPVAPQLHQPEEGQTVALMVSDRHDNIGMDPVADAIGKAAGATMLIDAGDDTSSGGSWEAFSLNSLAKQFKSYDRVGVAGNHDNGTFVVESLAKKGFTMLLGKPADVDGIRFLGDSDPRSSSVTTRYAPGDETLAEQDTRLTKVACDDGGVSVVVVHSQSSATKLATSGCVDLVLSGHLHRQVGPETHVGPNGRRTVTYTNGTTGGAVYAFALGSKLRRPAEVTLVTFEGGHPVALQPVEFNTGGGIEVKAYQPLGLEGPAGAPTAPTIVP